MLSREYQLPSMAKEEEPHDQDNRFDPEETRHVTRDFVKHYEDTMPRCLETLPDVQEVREELPVACPAQVSRTSTVHRVLVR